MRIFLAGATGALGQHLAPMLVGAGHDVVGTTRSPAKATALRAAGVEPAVVDALDRAAVHEAVAKAEPDVVIHQVTALAGMSVPRRFDEQFAQTNRLRTEGLDILLAAAEAAGARRFVAQSYAGWPFERVGGPVKDEEAPLDPHTSAPATLAAIRHLEAAVGGVPGLDGIALRYGGFYGPGTSLGAGGDVVEMVRKRRFPVVGAGTGIFSFCHIEDAARATLAAVEGGPPGIYNVVDDEPAPVSQWLPFLARAVGAKPPRRVPGWLARPLIGAQGMVVMTSARGASNAKAKRELRWAPRYPSWRDGFVNGLG
ncbi:MAG TPA: NAD(P)-dependent oxidoreductase [Mycobacteriales bacterium]|nr:NAD(P)-dependent oxidoreductase [Mycobacteriales bacterium]